MSQDEAIRRLDRELERFGEARGGVSTVLTVNSGYE